MKVPYTLLMIKPLSIGRGDGPKILESILENCPVVLRKFRSWSICDTTLFGLTQSVGDSKSNLDYEHEKIHCVRYIDSWIGIFTHIDRGIDPTDLLNTFCGPLSHTLCKPSQLRYDYGGYKKLGRNVHFSDTVVHISKPDRVNYECNLLFLKFDENDI